MILGIGSDIVEINRIKKIYEKFGINFLKRIYTNKEIFDIQSNSCKSFSRMANRFAAKEAFYKCLQINSKIQIPGWKDAEVIIGNKGKPYLSISGIAKKVCQKMVPTNNSYKIHLSLSDEHEYALAFVILELKKNI